MNNDVMGPSNMNNEFSSFNNMNMNNNMNNNVNMNNNMLDPNNNKKKGFNKIFFVFLVLILMAVTGFGGWKLGTMYANKEDNKTNDVTDKKEDTDEKDESKEDDKESDKESEKDVASKNEKYTFYKEVSVDIDLNGRPVNVLTYFYLDKEVLISDETEKNVTQYVLRRDVFVENNKILDGVIADVIDDEKDADKTIGYFGITLDNIDTFNDTSNSDEYLVLYFRDSNDLINGKELVTRYNPSVTRAYIVNNEGDLLKTIDYDNDIWGLVGIFADKEEIGDRNYVNTTSIYPDSFEVFGKSGYIADYMIYTEGVIDFHDTFIYYVTGDCVEFKEYKLSITNGKVKDEYIKTYSGEDVDVAGGC